MSHPPPSPTTPAAAEAIHLGHKSLLELAARGAPAKEVLQALAATAAGLVPPDGRAAIFLLDPKQPVLRFQTAHGMAQSYAQAVERLAIGPDQPSSGLAAHRGQPVIVADVTQDAAWQPYLLLAHAHNIGGCWSFPLHDSEGELLGTLALYLTRPGVPDAAQLEEVRFLTNIASLVVARENDARVRAQERLAADITLRDANRRKDLFFAVLGHELRNPIGTLRNSWHILQRMRETLPPPVPRMLDMMHNQIEQLVRLTDDLLDASRIAQGKLEMRMERIELHGAVQQAVDSARPLCAARRQTLDYEPLGAPVWVVADAARVTQMVTNLLTNASKFTPEGGQVRVKVQREAGNALVRVLDTGTGIAPQQCERIFEMFAQLDEGKRFGNQGLGIGLPLVKKLALLHGGSVEARSAGLGQGSEFLLRLPAQG